MNRYLTSLLTVVLAAGPHLARAQEGGSEGGGGGGILDVLGIKWQAVLIQICGFILLFIILRKFLFGPVQAALANRRSEIQGAYTRIDDQQRSVNRQMAELESRLSAIEEERRGIIQQAGREAQALQDQIVAEARQQADRIIEQGRRTIAIEQEKALATLREEMADLAVRAAGRLIGESLDGERQRRLVSDFIAQVGS